MTKKDPNIVDKYVVNRWNGNNIGYFTNLGYEFTAHGEEFLVKPEHLMPSSKIYVNVKCPSCKETRGVRYDNYVRNKSGICAGCCTKEIPNKNSKTTKPQKQKNNHDYVGSVTKIIELASDDGISLNDITKQLNGSGGINIVDLNNALTTLVKNGIIEKHSKYNHYFIIEQSEAIAYDEVVRAHAEDKTTPKKSLFDKMLARVGLKRI